MASIAIRKVPRVIKQKLLFVSSRPTIQTWRPSLKTYIYITVKIVVYVLLIWNVMKDVFGCRTELKPNLLLQRIKVYFSILNNTVRVSDFKHWLGTPLASARFQKSYRKLTGMLTWSLENASAPPTSFLCNISTWKHWKGSLYVHQMTGKWRNAGWNILQPTLSGSNTIVFL